MTPVDIYTVYIYILSRVEESHDRMSAMNAPKGVFIVRSQWRAVELRCCVFVLQDPLLSSAPSE